MRHDDADPDQPSIHKGAERHPTRVDVALEFVPLCFDGVLAVTVCVPGRRAPVSGPFHQLRPTLFVAEIDVLSPIDLADERELRTSQPPDLDAFLHCATIAHRPADPSGQGRVFRRHYNAAWYRPNRLTGIVKASYPAVVFRAATIS